MRVEFSGIACGFAVVVDVCGAPARSSLPPRGGQASAKRASAMTALHHGFFGCTAVVVFAGVATAIVEVPSGPEIVDVVSVFEACTSAVPVMAGAVDAALGAIVPSCSAAAVLPAAGDCGAPVPDVPSAARSVALPVVADSAG